jgi:predicted component of type VI protein secretion system
MPRIEVIRKGITPAVRPVPTDTTLAILPTTLDRVGKEVEDEDEQPVRIDSVNDAFEKFKPSIHFEALAGEGATAFVVDLEFHSLKDFAPEDIQKRVPGKRNDIADLQNTINLLYRLKDRWSLPPVRRAWNEPQLRKQIVAALARLRTELEKVAQAAKEGE